MEERCQGLREGEGELVLNGDRILVWEDEKVLKMCRITR